MAPATPHKTSRQIDSTINSLNERWNLQLPRLHGIAAENAKKDVRDTATKCSLAIRFLCWKSTKLDGAIEGFDDRAKALLSAWVYKPSQEYGTLLSLPKTKSFIKRDVLSKQGGNLTPAQRNQITKILLDVLNDEIELTNDSDAYEGTRSCARNSKTQARPKEHLSSDKSCSASHPIIPVTGQDSADNVTRTSPKKRSMRDDSVPQSEKKLKGQTSLNDFWPHTVNTAVVTTNQPLLPAPPKELISRRATPRDPIDWPILESNPTPATSFNTTWSGSTDQIFIDDEKPRFASSADTSIISFEDQNHVKPSQDLLPTQDYRDQTNDASFLSNLEAADGKVPFPLETIATTGPFRPALASLPPHLPWWYVFEVHRLSLATQQPAVKLHGDLARVNPNSSRSHDEFVSAARGIRKQNVPRIGEDSASIKSEYKEWTTAGQMYENSTNAKSVYFQGKLDFGGDLFTFSLKPATVDKSCRFHRRWGADRFMVINMPYLITEKVPRKFREGYKDRNNKIHDVVMKWLSSEDLHIAGRIWRAFWLEPDKSRTKTNRDIDGQRQKLHLFAVDGADFGSGQDWNGRGHKPMSLYDFMNWHTPFVANVSSSNLKLFSRFSLGLSKTIPTIQLMPTEFYHAIDPVDHEVMNDGAALMSLSLARAIWLQIGEPGQSLPSVFQGRIGGAKGLWMVDYAEMRNALSEREYWIEVSDSQLKIKPHPKDRLDADASQRTFELLQYPKPCAPGHLNTQLVNILANRKVTREVLRDFLLQDLRGYVEGTQAALTDPIVMRGWVQEYHKLRRDENPIMYRGGLPDLTEEQVCLLVESGFTASECVPIQKCVKKLMTKELNTYTDRMRIALKHSTHTFCIPDPYDILEPNEVYLGFSEEWENPITGINDNFLDNIDVLVARNPAHLASDIQKRRAVYKRELHSFKNVIVFSTRGEVSTASILSGGDYGGDTVAIIWDPLITAAFQNVDKPKLPTESDCGLMNHSKKLSALFVQSQPSGTELKAFLKDCLSFNAHPNLLGICTNEFEKLVYNDGALSGEAALTFAALAGYLVDLSKQGSFMTQENWRSIRKRFIKPEWTQPAYKSENPRPLREPHSSSRDNAQCVNVLDYLKFDVAQNEKDRALGQLNQLFDQSPSYDIKLSGLYKKADEIMSQPERNNTQIVLKSLIAQLGLVVEQWSTDIVKATHKKNANSALSHEDSISSTEFNAAIDRAYEATQAICPPSDASDCDIVRDFKANGAGKGSAWSLLRASTMYYRHHGKTVLWYIVGDELCRLRARSKGPTRELIPEMHRILKADNKLIGKLRPTSSFSSASAYEEGDDDEN